MLESRSRFVWDRISSALNVILRSWGRNANAFCPGVLSTKRSCIAQLFGLVIVTEDDKNEEKSQWDDDPKWIETLNFRGAWTR